MCNVVESLFILALAIVVAIGFVGMSHYMKFLSRLEKHHAADWNDLGQPTMFNDPPKFKGYGFFTYFSGAHYEKLNDPITVTFGDNARHWFGAAYVAGFTLLALFVAVSYFLKPALGSACWFI